MHAGTQVWATSVDTRFRYDRRGQIPDMARGERVDKLIISVATTGSRTMRSQTPYVPITEEEIAQQAVDCWRAGAAIAHIHVRDEREQVSCSPERYQKVTDLIRAAGSDIIVNWSTGGGAGMVVDEDRAASIRGDRLGDVACSWERTNDSGRCQARESCFDVRRRRKESCVLETANGALVVDALEFDAKPRVVCFFGPAEKALGNSGADQLEVELGRLC